MGNSILNYIKKKETKISMEDFEFNQGEIVNTDVNGTEEPKELDNIPSNVEGYENFKLFFENFSSSIESIKEVISNPNVCLYSPCDAPIFIDYITLKSGREKIEASLKMIIDYFTSYTTTGTPAINHEESPYVDFLEEIDGKVVFAPLPYTLNENKRLEGFYFLKEDLENDMLLAVLDEKESNDVCNNFIVINGFKKITEEKESFFDKISPLLTNIVAIWEEVLQKVTVDEEVLDIDSLLRGIDSSRILIDSILKVVTFLRKSSSPVSEEN